MHEQVREDQRPTDRAGDAAPVSAGTRWWQQPLMQIGLILGLGLGLYLHTLHAPFIFDDYLCITENPAIRSFAYFADYDKVRGLAIWVDIKNNFALRTVTYWTFALNYKIGRYNEFGYHLVNIAIHLLNAVLVYFLARATLKRAPLVSANSSVPRLVALVPLLVALLFVAHPLQTQAVTYVAQRFTSLATLFYLSALLLYIAARTAEKPGLRWGYCSLALLTTIVAMKTKEIAFTLPVILLLYELFFFDGRLRQRILWLAPFFLTMLIIPGTILWLLATDGADNSQGGVEQAINLVNFSGVSQWGYLMTQFGAIVTYLRLFFLPVGQNVIPDYPLARSFFEPKIIGSFLLLLLLFGGAIGLALRSLRVRQRSAGLLIAFGALWFFITIAMSSSFIPLDAMMLEYRIYLPSFGFFFTIVLAATLAVDRGWLPQRVFIGAVVLIIVMLSVATVARNNVYNDEVALLRDVLAKNPEALGARIGLVNTYLERERYDEAIAELTRILEIIPNDSNMIVNLGIALFALGRDADALEQYRKALVINPEHPYVHYQLGILNLNKGWIDAAEAEFRKTLVVDPHFGAARYRLAILYEEQGRRGEAVEQFGALLISFPGDPKALAGLERLGARD